MSLRIASSLAGSVMPTSSVAAEAGLAVARQESLATVRLPPGPMRVRRNLPLDEIGLPIQVVSILV